MLNFENAILEKVIIHKVGNKERDEELITTQTELKLSEPIKDILKHYFLSGFKDEAFYSFTHEADIQQNVIYNFSKQIFNDSSVFVKVSVLIAEHLYMKSSHPKIKTGELYIAYISNCIVEDELVNVLGIFKSETKETFLKVTELGKHFELSAEKGININKIDKACLVFDTEIDLGYKISIVDNINKTIEAQYWRQDFLNIKQREDDFYQTQNFMNVCKGFVDEVYNADNQIEKPEQISMMNKSVNYFKEKDTFDINDFKDNVLKQPEIIDAFDQYKKQFEEINEVTLNDSFEISENALKKNKTKFKSVLKLDKNFHIYIHGDENKIVKGFDELTGMNFYQIFYETEE